MIVEIAMQFILGRITVSCRYFEEFDEQRYI